jgi:hypothetical protein
MPGGNRLSQIPANRIDRDADLAGNCLLANPATGQRPNRGHHLAFDHRHLRRRRYQHAPLKLHSPLLRGVRISVVRGSISLSLYTEYRVPQFLTDILR